MPYCGSPLVILILPKSFCIEACEAASSFPNVMLLFLYSAAIFFHSSTFGTPALVTASCAFGTGCPVLMSLISMNETGMRPGPPNLPIGFATNHSGFDWAITMIASPCFASSSSGLSALKSYCTMPYTMAPEPEPRPILGILMCPLPGWVRFETLP